MSAGNRRRLNSSPNLSAAIVAHLDWRTGHGGVGTVHTAVSRQRLKNRLAALAVVEPLTGIGGHSVRFDMPAFGASDR